MRRLLVGGIATCVLLAMTALQSAADDVTFSASVDKNPVGLGDQVTLSLELKNAGAGGGKNLQLPDLGKFRIMAGPNQSSTMQFVNGVISSSITYSYVLQPTEMGNLTIGPATIEAGGNTYRSAPITLEVVKGSTHPQAKQPSGSPDVASQIGDNLFLKATVDRTRVLQGEQINLTFKLYTRISVVNYSVEKNPTMTGFWSEEVENPKNIELTTEVLNGKQYRVGVIRKLALFPTQSGTLEISPMEVQTTVQVQNRSMDPFDSFFRDPFGRNVNYPVKSEPIKIRVEALPPGAPAGFKGAIGNFRMTAGVDRNNAKTNEPITLTVKISGTGNVKLLESPEVNVPTDFEQYTPKVSDNISRSGQISGTKTFEYLLIPRYPGTKRISPVKFVYFDLNKRSYVTLRSEEITLSIEQGAAGTPSAVAGVSRGDVQLLSQDIRFIKVTDPGFRRRGEYLYNSGLFLSMLVLPLLGLGGAFVYSRRREAVAMDEVGYRRRRALKVARKGLRQAETLLGKRSETSTAERKISFYSEIARALWKYLGDKFNIPPGDLSIDRTQQELARRAVNGEVSASLKTLLELCEMARFAPTSISEAMMHKSYADAKNIIVELERTLRSR
jgi:hypothetical protein